MGKRLVVGLFEGLLLGSALAAGLVAGLGLGVVGPALAYGLAALAGVLTALVAGKPIWAKGAKLEVGLKALVGGFIALVALYVARRWLAVEIDLSALGAGAGALGELPAAFVPAITTGLSVLFELDHDEAGAEQAQPKKRIEAPKSRVGGDAGAGADEATGEASAGGRRARRQG